MCEEMLAVDQYRQHGAGSTIGQTTPAAFTRDNAGKVIVSEGI